MTDTPAFDAHGWCHDMSAAPKGECIDIWDGYGERKPECSWDKTWHGGKRVWCYRHMDENYAVESPTAWRYPPAPPVGE